MADKSVIVNIEARTRQLIDDHRRLTALCAELTAQCESLKNENREQQEKIRSLDAELGRMQLAEGLTGEATDKKKARTRVNHLMREVDKCIALLTAPVDRQEEIV